MPEEKYKELNKYLNELFRYLDKYHKFILDNMLIILNIFLEQCGHFMLLKIVI